MQYALQQILALWPCYSEEQLEQQAPQQQNPNSQRQQANTPQQPGRPSGTNKEGRTAFADRKSIQATVYKTEELFKFAQAEMKKINNIKRLSKEKKSLLEELKQKYPYKDSPFNKYRDRDPIFQYHKLVSTKNLRIAEFVLKHEHESGQRIHKDMAQKLLTELKRNGDVSDEFLQNLVKEFKGR